MHMLGQAPFTNMLRITTERKRGRLLLTVEGCLSGTSVSTLEQCWRELRASRREVKFSVNLCGVSFIDTPGKVLLKEIHRQGGQLLAEGCLNQAILREIVAGEKEVKGTRPGAVRKGAHIFFYGFLLFTLLPGALSAQQVPATCARPTDVLRLTHWRRYQAAQDMASAARASQEPSGAWKRSTQVGDAISVEIEVGVENALRTTGTLVERPKGPVAVH
jgi:hypothetical protein